MVELPGDKSISHRYAMLAALARGRSEIENYSPAADCASTLQCVGNLGAKVERLNGNGKARVAVTGAGLDGWKRPRKTLDAENSGTTLRLMTGLLAGQKFDSAITGDASLRRRPMKRVIEPLALMGARIEARESNFAPLEIHGAPLHPIEYALPVASAQVKSAILLAGLLAEGESSVRGESAHAGPHRAGAGGIRRDGAPRRFDRIRDGAACRWRRASSACRAIFPRPYFLLRRRWCCPVRNCCFTTWA